MPLNCLSDENSWILNREFSMEEVELVLKQTGGNITHGIDGISYSFIKAYWDIIKIAFWNAINHFLCFGKLNEVWKDTLIILIPKVSNLMSPSNYRPTSLCNSTYKVAAKVILNKLVSIIPKLIYEE
ncbi:hypothetical protein KFK09_004758 [Dendrobium nobile]|uniref:Reverse transcriptase n=1 Tax=Dendrobium nobile TaxID=94219 RepID=A0A8T3BYU1_DENNO|nr:hypothetical protein KFK09_004758 [Dendrobium nobile]